MRYEQTERRGSYIVELIKTVIVALIISLLLILLTALIVKVFNIPDTAIPIINQVIKGLSILLACLICFKGSTNGWIRGLVAGLIYMVLAYVVFSLLAQNFEFGLNLLNDVALGSVTGLISGIIAVNLKKNKNY